MALQRFDMRTRRASTDVEMMAAAYLKGTAGIEGVSEGDIGKRLDLHPSRVSRLLAEAREANILRPEVFDRLSAAADSPRHGASSCPVLLRGLRCSFQFRHPRLDVLQFNRLRGMIQYRIGSPDFG
jgi:hypothetical protein